MRIWNKKAIAFALIAAMVFCLLPTAALAAAGAPTSSVTFTMSDAGVAVSGGNTGYEIEGTALTITSAGTYTVTGSCAEGNVTVKKGVTGVTLVLSDLALSCSTTAPVLCKKSTGVTIDIAGTVTLTDAETDESDENYEGAAIKVNSESAALTICGDGTLNVIGNSKNGIKAGATSSIRIKSGTVNVTAANNGIAADGAVSIEGGTVKISAGNEGLKAVPDEDDTESAGTVTISGGVLNMTSSSDGIQAAGDIVIRGGTITIKAQSDGIQTGSDLTISGGTFDITTLSGYQSSGFNSSTMSCKGLKATSGDDETENASNTITISGGDFTLNTADDAVHSDGYVVITGGTFDIKTGDDGVHADTSLTLGSSDGYERDPFITVHYSYEGLEAGNIYIYGGKYYVYATDDGVNAAGGSSSGSDPGMGGGNHFNPGGGPGGFGNQGRFGGTTGSGSYSLNIYGGDVYVNAQGDGLDANGSMTLSGGNIEVWGQSSGDNEPLDYDGTLTVNGATVFAAGCAGMGQASPVSGSQAYKNVSKSVSSGQVISVTSGSTTLYQAKAPKSVSYIFFSSPAMTGSAAVSSGSGSVSCACGNAWTHTWDSGVVTKAATENSAGRMTYTCSVCGETERQTLPAIVSTESDAESDTGNNTGSDAGEASDNSTCPFSDVASGSYYYDAVLWAYGNGITDGTGATAFSPDNSCTRGQIVTFLWRALGKPSHSVSNPFSDVASDSYYYDAVLWAYENGITDGTDATTFSPEKTCTRGQAVTFLWRAAGKLSSTGSNSFSDVKAGSYYFDSVLWATESGITNGTSASTFSPDQNCTRGQIVTFLYRARSALSV